MRGIVRNKKTLRIAVVLAAVLLTATILAVATIQSQNQNQNAYPIINLHLLGFSQSPNTVIQPKYDISTNEILNGSVYYETINVLADDIVIDGNGSTIQGPGTETGYGFYLNGRSNVTIFNVIVTGWDAGFYLSGSSGNNLTGNTATNNGNGFRLYTSSNNNLTGNNATNNYYGSFTLSSSSYNILSGNNATSNNGDYGFGLSSSSYNTLTGNTAYNNVNGFYLSGGSNNNLTGNIATNSNNYGFYLTESSTGNDLLGNIALNSTTGGYIWSVDSVNNNFTGSVDAYYLRVNVTDSGGLPISGAQVQVVSNGTITVWYATPHFGGVDSPTGEDGLTPWFAVPYQTFITNDTLTNNTNTITVWYSTAGKTAVFSDNPRTGFDMSTSHTEDFTLTSWRPSALQSLLPVLLLAGTQGGTSPLIYAALGIAGLAAVAAVLIYYFRIRKV